MLGFGVAEIVQVVCVTLVECKSVLHVLHVRYVLVISVSNYISRRIFFFTLFFCFRKQIFITSLSFFLYMSTGWYLPSIGFYKTYIYLGQG